MGKHTFLESLTFSKGRFVLHEASTPKLRLRLSKDPNWKGIGDDNYETTSLRAARVFKEYASPQVEKIFKKVFQEHYGPPHLSVLLLPEHYAKLDPHQRAGIEWVLSRKRSYLAHAPGAGKTAQAILASQFTEADGQVLFIVPPSLVKNWEREIFKFTEWLGVWPTIGIVRTSDRPEEVAWNSEFLIVPDSMLTKDWVYTKLLSIKKKFIAVDEGSRFKDPFAARSLAFYGGQYEGKVYTGLFRDARHVVFLDGSPMPNRPMELWAPLYALDPECIDCMDMDDFGYRYCGAKPNEYGQWEYLHSSHEAELHKKITAGFMHVVKEHDLAHPARRRSMVFVDDRRKKEHKKWERANLTSGIRLKETDSQGDLAHFRRLLGLSKIPSIVRRTKECLAKGESILLFVWHREVAYQLTEKLSKYNPACIIGGVDSTTRESAFTEFQAGTRKLLIMNIASGGRGHNLQKADRVIFGEFSWTDETNKQAEKRASRKGSEKAFVRCEYLVVANSMDEIVLNSVFTKEKRVKRIIG